MNQFFDRFNRVCPSDVCNTYFLCSTFRSQSSIYFKNIPHSDMFRLKKIYSYWKSFKIRLTSYFEKETNVRETKA